MAHRRDRAGLALSLALALQACTVGPNYVRPTAPTASAFKEAGPFRLARPADAVDRGPWWAVFGDPVLDGLLRRVELGNQNLAAAEAAYRQARALTAEDRAAFFPTITASGSAQRSKSGSSRAVGGTIINSDGTQTSSGGGSSASNNFSLSLGASWAADVWGRIRRMVEADRASAQASAADLASARLSYQAELASDYFELRAQDEQSRLLDETVRAYSESLRVTQNRYAAGVIARADVITAQSQLQSAQAQALDLGVRRAQLEHAIAVLVGVAPAELTLAVARLPTAVPEPTAGLPSALLERRPDIAASERRVAAANARIGVATAAYYPDVTLSGDFGQSASTLGSLLSSAANFWSLGSNAAATLLDFGARRARVRQSRAAYDQAVAQYRQTTLTALQAVEDQLVAQRLLRQELGVRQAAEAGARRAQAIALNQYRSGLVDFTTVVQAQANAFSAAQAVLDVQRRRLAASVALIEALGGGWAAADLPKS